MGGQLEIGRWRACGAEWSPPPNFEMAVNAMKRHVHLQTRDLEIGRRLGRCYRITTAAIEAEHYGVHEKTMGNRLNRLTESKFLNRLTVLAKEVDVEAEPILKWSPGRRGAQLRCVSEHGSEALEG